MLFTKLEQKTQIFFLPTKTLIKVIIALVIPILSYFINKNNQQKKQKKTANRIAEKLRINQQFWYIFLISDIDKQTKIIS